MDIPEKLKNKWTFHHNIFEQASYVYQITDFLQLANINTNYIYDTKKEAELALIKDIHRRIKEIEEWLVKIENEGIH